VADATSLHLEARESGPRLRDFEFNDLKGAVHLGDLRYTSPWHGSSYSRQ